MQVNTGDTTSEKARGIIEKYGYSKLIDAWGHQPPTILTLHNYPRFLTHVEIPSKQRNNPLAAQCVRAP